MKVLSVAYISSFIARQLFHGVNCDACKAYLMSQSVFIYLKECSDMEHFLTYPEKWAGIVGAFVISTRGLTAEVVDLNSVEQCITAAIKKTVDFELGLPVYILPVISGWYFERQGGTW
jgi:hypothetical protein